MDSLKNFTFYGCIAGIIMALLIIFFGWSGFFLIALLGAVGAACGAQLDGRIDLRAAFNSTKGRG